MTNEKPLTKSDLVAALKEAGVATKDDVRQIVGEEITSRGLATKDDVQQIVGKEIVSRGLATKGDVQQVVDDVLHEKLAKFHQDITVPKLNSIRQEIKAGFEQTNSRFEKLKEGQQ